MANENGAWTRQGEVFWRAHHEAWKRSDLKQRQYCAAQGIPLKAFGNWRAQFKAEPQSPERKLLYRRPRLSPPLSPPASPLLSPVGYPSSHSEHLIIPRPREGHRLWQGKDVTSPYIPTRTRLRGGSPMKGTLNLTARKDRHKETVLPFPA